MSTWSLNSLDHPLTEMAGVSLSGQTRLQRTRVRIPLSLILILTILLLSKSSTPLSCEKFCAASTMKTMKVVVLGLGP